MKFMMVINDERMTHGVAKTLLVFLRATAECFAGLGHRLDVCSSGLLSVCHTRDLYRNGAS